MPNKTICQFSADNGQLLQIAAEAQKALGASPDVAETIHAQLVPHARDLAEAYRSEIITIRSTAGANQSVGDLYVGELQALEALVNANDASSMQEAVSKLLAIPSRVTDKGQVYDPRRR